MSQGLYELIALAARYVFAALMVLIVLRAWRLTIVDSRRAQTLRRLSPETGLSGELIVLEGYGQARRGMHYPVIREGMIGSSRGADVRVRNSSVRRRHAWFQLTPEGLSVRSHAGAPLKDRKGRAVRELLLKDGGVLYVGKVKLMLVLTESTAPQSREDAPYDDDDYRDDYDVDDTFDADDLFDVDPFDAGEMFANQPVLRKGTVNRNR